MREAFTRRQGLCLRLRPQDRAGPAQEIPAILAEEGFTHQEDVKPYTTVEMDVSLPEDRFLGNLARSWRQQLHRAERNDLDIREGTGPELFGAFRGLYGEMKERKQFVTFVDIHELEAVQQRLAEPLKMRIALCSVGQEPVAGLVYSALGETAVGILAATSGRGRELGAAYLTWRHTVGLLRERGLRRFDLGGVDVENAPGPAHFKKGLAGKSGGIVQHIGQFDAPGSALSRFCLGTGSSLQKAYRRLRLGHRGTPRDAVPVGAGAGAGGEEREEGHHG
jgi:lipid II:glycine glycyltransferase (peptidoglycan interpeptide bridge formation enzyme)